MIWNVIYRVYLERLDAISRVNSPHQKKKKKKKKRSSYQYMSANSYRDTDQHHHVINTNTTDAIKKKNPSLPTLVG